MFNNVNGCPECLGKDASWAYCKCEKHDVCVSCGIKRKDLKEIPWGHVKGFMCRICKDIENERIKLEALEKVAGKEYDEWDFYNINECKCPHCETEYQEIYENEKERICDVCNGKFSIEVEYEPRYTMSIIGERVTL